MITYKPSKLGHTDLYSFSFVIRIRQYGCVHAGLQVSKAIMFSVTLSKVECSQQKTVLSSLKHYRALQCTEI